MKLRKIALLFFILGVGVSLEAAYHLRSNMDLDLGPFGWRVLGGRFNGPSFEFTQSVTEPIPSGATVEVGNGFGAVRVFRGSGKDAVVRLRKVVFERTEAEARAFADRIHVEKNVSNQTLRFTTNRASLGRGGSSWDVGFETHFEIELPEGTPVKIANEHGDVDVSDVASATIENAYGAVAVSRVAGRTDVRCEHGDVHAIALKDAAKFAVTYGDVNINDAEKSVTLDVEKGDAVLSRVGSLDARLQYGDLAAETVAGDASIHGQHTEVDFKDVAGRAVVETAYRDVTLSRIKGEGTVKSSHGAVSASEIGGALFVEAAYGDVDVTNVAGVVEISVDHGSVEADRLLRGARVKSPGGDVKLVRFGGPVDVESERGSIELQPSSAIVDPIRASTRYGTVDLSVPDGSRFDLEASSETGEVRVDNLNGYAASASTSSDEKAAHRTSAGKVGGGGKAVSLRAAHGDVTLQSVRQSATSND